MPGCVEGWGCAWELRLGLWGQSALVESEREVRRISWKEVNVKLTTSGLSYSPGNKEPPKTFEQGGVQCLRKIPLESLGKIGGITENRRQGLSGSHKSSHRQPLGPITRKKGSSLNQKH